ncbi:MAG: retroviral-like aspartic protease family protein [Deltaproteobacteria bacterium]|nr:retroviral-like aspartic protease family protein [Deltaproteobacteria bacterium]
MRQGLNVGLITFIGDNGRRTTLSVTVNYGTGLAVDPGSVSVDVRPGSGTRTFQVGLTSNDGQNFDWVAGATTGWLTIEPASGTGATYYPVNITIDEAKLSMGSTSSTVTFRTPDGRWATLQVNVNKTNAVVGAKVVPDTLSLTVASGAKGNFNLVLSGMDNFGYVAATDQTWLSVNPPNATGANIYSVTGQADATNLTPGQYSGHIYFTLSDGHTLPVTVNLTVKPVWQPSHIGVNPANPVYLAEEGTNKVVVFQVFDAVNNASSFTWSVNSDVSWLKVSHGPYSQPMDLSVYIDVKAMALMPPNADCSGMSCYGGTLTFTSNLNTGDTLQVPVKVILYVKGTLQDINTERLELSTSSWMALSYEMEKNLSIPGRVFVLVEHKQLLPNQVWAYRVDANGENRLDLFSRFGRYTNNAWDLSYAPDARSLSTVNFGGFRLIGVEGDAVVRVMAGTSLNDLVELKRWDITIRPLTGEWEISDLFNGKWYKYPDLLLFSERYGTLQAQWGGVPISIGYGQSVQQKDIPWISFCPNTSGQWLCYNGVPMAGNADYEFFITRNTVGGPMEFRYNITQIDGNTITGEWQYRWVGAQSWSLPERFEMRAHGGLVIPFDATRNAYYVNGTVKGRNNVEYPVRFQVDTGAAFVLLDKNMAEYLGIDLTNPEDPGYKAARCQPGSGVGVGGTVSVTYCTVSNITLDGKVSKNNVEVGFGDWPQPALLGMTFLEGFSVTINSADKSMNIGP